MASFIATGAFGLVPLLHLLSSTQTQYAEAAEGMATMAALYVCGALLYGFRVPERFFPGRFDWGGTSHNVSWRRALRIALCTPQVEPITIACGVLSRLMRYTPLTTVYTDFVTSHPRVGRSPSTHPPLSVQIFHICVVAACIVHYRTVMGHYRWRVQNAVCHE